jgi:hypothetical protein
LSNPYASPDLPKTWRFFTSFLVDGNIRPAEKLLTAAKMFSTGMARLSANYSQEKALEIFTH